MKFAVFPEHHLKTLPDGKRKKIGKLESDFPGFIVLGELEYAHEDRLTLFATELNTQTGYGGAARGVGGERRPGRDGLRRWIPGPDRPGGSP